MQSFGKSVTTAILIMLAYAGLLGMYFILVYSGKVDANTFVDKLWTILAGLGSALAYFFGHRNGAGKDASTSPALPIPPIVPTTVTTEGETK